MTPSSTFLIGFVGEFRENGFMATTNLAALPKTITDAGVEQLKSLQH